MKVYNLSIEKEAYLFEIECHKLKNEGAIVKLNNVMATRSNLQNSARWLYLGMIANMLNERGDTFNVEGTKIEAVFTKDLLYEVYWQTLRKTMYPNKRQLNTAEFSKLVDTARMMFAQIFDISIPFPNIKDKLLKDKNNL